MACEMCWADAYWRSVFGDTSKSQEEHYRDLLEERKENPCNEYEQNHGRKVNQILENPIPEELCQSK
jgi:hypothetical protein